MTVIGQPDKLTLAGSDLPGRKAGSPVVTVQTPGRRTDLGGVTTATAFGSFDASPGTRGAHLPEARSAPGPTGWCFNVQRFSIHDGPGIRTTVFLKGCPLSCPWCHNPEGRAAGPELRIIEGRCIRCRSCEAACPHGVARPGEIPDPERCHHCWQCVEACPTEARQVVGSEVTAYEIVGLIERDLAFYEGSGGGATFSGGEPFAQPRFLLACLGELRSRAIHTAVDTCGFVSRQLLLKAAAVTDLFLYDLKVMNPKRHVAVTGVPLEPILDNLRTLDRAGARIWLRVPLVPGYTDDPANLEAIGAFAASLVATRRLHLLPYHRLGVDKRRGLRIPDELTDTTPPSASSLEAAEMILRKFDLDIHVGG